MKQKEFNLKNVFGNTPYWIVNKKMCELLGFEATLILQHFYDLETKVFHGEFYQTHDQITLHLGLKRRRIENAINLLKESGFLQVYKKGLPQQNYYKIETANLATFLLYEETFPQSVINSGLAATKNTV
jgi:hypothetical protein